MPYAQPFGETGNLGDTRSGPTIQGEARRFTERNAVQAAAMWNGYAERAKRSERYEPRELEDLFGGEA